ncbi:MAG: S6e family ribosomal protein [Nanoarchaeota archaeon]|nr:S6e family ribosomal protein [Nanoarchaeota archaeon]
MVFKFIIGDNKGKAWRMERDADFLMGKSIGEEIDGKEFGEDFSGYLFLLSGGSDLSGFPLSKDVEGLGLRRLMLKKGWGMNDKRDGVRLRKTVRGKVISEKVVQINIKVLKHGKKKLEEIFPDQNKKEEPKVEEKKAEVAVVA